MVLPMKIGVRLYLGIGLSLVMAPMSAGMVMVLSHSAKGFTKTLCKDRMVRL